MHKPLVKQLHVIAHCLMAIAACLLIENIRVWDRSAFKLCRGGLPWHVNGNIISDRIQNPLRDSLACQCNFNQRCLCEHSPCSCFFNLESMKATFHWKLLSGQHWCPLRSPSFWAVGTECLRTTTEFPAHLSKKRSMLCRCKGNCVFMQF